jgi:hypothetical protein
MPCCPMLGVLASSISHCRLQEAKAEIVMRANAERLPIIVRDSDLSGPYQSLLVGF